MIALLAIALAAAPSADGGAAAPDPGTAGAPAVVQTVTVAAAGDVMLGSSWPTERGLPADDGRSLLAEVAPILQGADVAFGNLEGPLIDKGTSSKCKPTSLQCFAFRVPTRFARTLKESGFTVMNLANNHAKDFGDEGWQSSRRTLDAVGIAHTGELGDVARLTVKGRKVAVVGFSNYQRMHDLNDLPAARALVEQLSKESELVVVSFHGGAEGISKVHVPLGHEIFLAEDRGDLRAFAHAVIDAGAALVVGHGPHVPRGMEVYRGRLIAYSLGNFATWDKMNLTGPLGITLVLEVKLGPDGALAGGRVHAARQLKPGGARLDPEETAVKLISKLSKEDFGASAVDLAEDGTIRPPEPR